MINNLAGLDGQAKETIQKDEGYSGGEQTN